MNRLTRQLSILLLGRRKAGLRFTGDYATWDDALQNSIGYDAPAILSRTRAAMLKVKRGEAVYERDSVVFDKVEHSFPVLAGLLRAALSTSGRLVVLDFFKPEGGLMTAFYKFYMNFVVTKVGGAISKPCPVCAHTVTGASRSAAPNVPKLVHVPRSLM